MTATQSRKNPSEQDNLQKQSQKAPQAKKSLQEQLTSMWPGLRYLSLGVLLAWMYLVMDFGAWMTSTDNANLSVIDASMRVYGVSAVAMLLAAWKQDWFKKLFSLHHVNAGIAALAVLGATLLIISGPAFLQFLGFSNALLVGGGVLIGLAVGLMILRIAQLYCNLEPSRILFYAVTSELLVAVLFYIVTGNAWLEISSTMPSLCYLLAVLVLPVITMGLVSLPSSNAPEKPGNGREDNKDNLSSSKPSAEQEVPVFAYVRALPMAGKLMLVIFVLSAVVSIVRNLFMASQPPTTHQLDAQQAMLLRMALAVILLIFALFFAERVSLGKVYLFGMVGISLIVATLPLFGLHGSFLLACTCALLSVIDLVMWCLLTFVAKANGFQPLLVFGLGKGFSHAGMAIGYALGYYDVLSLLKNDDGTVSSLLTVVLIALAVVCVAVVFTEKDFDTMLKASGVTHLDVSEALAQRQESQRQKKEDRPWKKACWIVGERAMLSKREQELLEEMARNRTPQEIATRLNITVATVRAHTHHVYTKLDVHSRDELIELVRTEYEKL